MIYLLCGLSFIAGLLFGWTLYDWSADRSQIDVVEGVPPPRAAHDLMIDHYVPDHGTQMVASAVTPPPPNAPPPPPDFED